MHFLMIGNCLFRRDTYDILRRCVFAVEVAPILTTCHNIVCGGHFSRHLTGYKILRAWYFWPIPTWESTTPEQKYAKNDLRMKLPQHVLVPLIPFQKWGNDYIRHYKKNDLFQQSFNWILPLGLELMIRNNFNTKFLIEALVHCPSHISKII